MSENHAWPEPRLREPQIRTRRSRPHLVWIVPLAAVGIGLALLIHARLMQGPIIAVAFSAAGGLESGKTPVKFKDVIVGSVIDVALSPDHTVVNSRIQFDASAQSLLGPETRFWIVRPQIGAGGISGIDTLLSGVYVALDPGKAGRAADRYTALDTPPMVTSGRMGSSYLLTTADIGSIGAGSPIYFRHIEAGRVAGYTLDPATQRVTLRIFIDAPYDGFVTPATRFWNASGVDLSLTAAGIRLTTQSLATIIAGGIAFDSPPNAHEEHAAATETAFALAPDRAIAMADPDGTPLPLRMRFTDAVRGLEIGAPVEFFGVAVGAVQRTALDYEPATRKFSVVADVVLYSNRLGLVVNKLPTAHGDVQKIALFLAALVKDGLRAQARTGNLLTGQLYIALDFVAHAPGAAFDADSRPLEIPTAPGALTQVQEQLGDIIARIQKIPFDSIGRGIDRDLAHLEDTLSILNASTLPKAETAMTDAGALMRTTGDLMQPDAPLHANLNELLRELTHMSRSMRALADGLQAHPESLLRGRQATGGVPLGVDPPATRGTPE